MSYIPYGRQDINDEDIQSVVDVLTSDFLTQGPAVPAFEERVAEYCGSSHAVAVNSATSALHLACLALKVGKGDLVWTTPITFVASANCALYCGASVDFVDIDPRTYNMCVKQLRIKLERARLKNKLPQVVIPVHLCGQPCEMKQIHQLSQEFGFRIIEDASHAIGGLYQNEKIGNCRYSDITIFSFHPVKIITTAEGGLALTNQGELAKSMQLLRSHGITRDPSRMVGSSDGAWYYQQVDLGFNYRMTDMQAALGFSQMQRLDGFVRRRHELAKSYDKLLSQLPIKLPVQHADSYSGLHLYVIRLRLDSIKLSHREVFDALRQNGVGVNLHYIPVHTQPYYQAMGFQLGDFPASEQYYQEAISLPMFSALTDEQQLMVVKNLAMILK